MNTNESRAWSPDPRAMPTRFQRRTFSTNRRNFSYVIGGAGPPLALLHGWPQTSRAWDPVLPAFADAGYTTVAPDLPGMGESDALPVGSGKDAVAEVVHDLLRSLFPAEPLRVIGHDIGAMVAFSWARLHPEDVIRLGVVETGMPGLGLEQAMDVARGGRWHHGFFMTPDVPEMLIDGSADEFFRWWFGRLSANKAPFGPADVAATVTPYRGREALERSFRHYRTLLDDGRVNAAWVESGGRFAMPVAGVGGEFCLGTSVADNLEAAAPDLLTIVVEGSGHFPAEEQPARFVESVLAFLGAGPERH
jgi:pimeloyl-ACP methyl ester carboxylesterase